MISENSSWIASQLKDIRNKRNMTEEDVVEEEIPLLGDAAEEELDFPKNFAAFLQENRVAYNMATASLDDLLKIYKEFLPSRHSHMQSREERELVVKVIDKISRIVDEL